MSLNDSRCKNAKPKEKNYKLNDMEGLYLFIKKNGKKYWRFKYRYNDIENGLSFGEYPTVTLQEARLLKDEAKKQLREGQNPAFLRDEKKRLARFNCEQTLELVTWEWYEIQKPSWSVRHARIIKARLQRGVIDKIGKYQFNQLTPRILFNCLQEAEKESPEFAKRLLQFLTRICQHANLTERLDKDITFGLQNALQKTKHGNYACLETDEIPDFVKKLYAPINGNDVIKNYATKLLMHCLTRTIELIHAERAEFNLENRLWTIPASRMKMDNSHLVPLSDQVMEILGKLDVLYGKHRKFLFPSPVKRNQPISKNIILKELERLGYKNIMTGHGFRAMGLTVGTETLDFKFEVIDRQLSHVPKGEVRQAYDRGKYLTKRKKFMQTYSDYLESFINPTNRKGNNDKQLYYFRPYTTFNTAFKFFRSNEGSKQYQPIKPQQWYKVRQVPQTKIHRSFTILDSPGNTSVH